VKKLNSADIAGFLDQKVTQFYNSEIKFLKKLRLENVLKNSNFYLCNFKNTILLYELLHNRIKSLLEPFEDKLFNNLFMELAIFICGKVYGGKKSTSEGIDLEFEKDKTKYIVSIKSGPNWGNSQQINRMKDNFKKAKKRLGTNSPKANVITVNGCCYGIDDNPDKGDYLKLCGQRFWSFISGDENLYTDIIEPLGYKAKEKNEKFSKEYGKVINKFTVEFAKYYCDADGNILWDGLVKLNSGKKKNIDIDY